MDANFSMHPKEDGRRSNHDGKSLSDTYEYSSTRISIETAMDLSRALV
jgi:hypothetical protein